MANKVEFGISQLHVGTWEDDGEGNITLGSPYHQKGAISFSPEQDAQNNTLDADNIPYWAEYTEGSPNGDLNVAMFDDDFKTKFLGYAHNTNGGLGRVKGKTKPNVYVAFQVEGDKESKRAIFYNCTLGPIGRAYNTIASDGKEPDTETIPITCIGDAASGKYMDTFKPDDSGYDSLFTSPAAPEIESES